MTVQQQAQYRAQMICELVAKATKNAECLSPSDQVEDAKALANFVIVIVHNFGTSIGLTHFAMNYMHAVKITLDSNEVYSFNFSEFYKQCIIFAQRLESGEHV